MCNGLCIPAIIPCNNTCLDNVEWSVNKTESLYGPLTCSKAMYKAPLYFVNKDQWPQEDEDLQNSNSDLYWTGALDSEKLSLVQEIIGHTDSELSVCLPGFIGCDGTCSIDPQRPLIIEGKRKGEIGCVTSCDQTHRPFECNGRCYENESDCNEEL